MATKRWIPRLIHLIFSIPIVGYVYSPFKELPNYAPVGSVCRHSRTCRDGTLDVERSCASTSYFELRKEMNPVAQLNC
jgi:hypothetical protein